MFLLGWSPMFWTVGYKQLIGQEGECAQESASLRRSAGAEFRTLLARVMTPPIIGCLSGLAVGLTPPLRAVLLPSMDSPSVVPLFRCLQTFGKAYAPAALLVLAGSLASVSPIQSKKGEGADGNDDVANVLPTRALFAIMISRFLLVPLASYGGLSLVQHLGILKADPLRDMIILMQSFMPSAQNSVLALQVRGNPSRATRMARSLLVVYLLGMLPVSLLLTVLLQHSGFSMCHNE